MAKEVMAKRLTDKQYEMLKKNQVKILYTLRRVA